MVPVRINPNIQPTSIHASGPQQNWRPTARAEIVRSGLPGPLAKTIVDDLIYAVSVRRGPDPQGASGIMTASQAIQSGHAYASASAAEHRQFNDLHALYSGSGSTDTCRRCLLLKAFGVLPERRARRWQAIQQFARDIGGVGRRKLLDQTTLLDIDSGRNTSRPTSGLGLPDRADDDGLLQKHTSSCGPAAVEAILGERDPIHAWLVHREGGPQLLTGGTISETFQAMGLTDSGDIAQLRHGYFEYRRLRQFCSELADAGALGRGERQALLYHCRTPGSIWSDKARMALAKLRRRRFPTAAAIARMRQATPAVDSLGIDADSVRRIMRKTFGTHGCVRTSEILDTGREAFVAIHLREIAKSVRRGGVVLGTTRHWWAMVDVREVPSGFDFLIHDTGTGISHWVDQKALIDGTFSASYFTRKPDSVTSFVTLRIS